MMSEDINVNAIDFGKHRAAMVGRFGASTEICDIGFFHLKSIIADAQSHSPGRYYALPYAADQAMHVLLLDNVFVHRVSEQLFGKGNLMAHDPFPPEGPARVIAWENTRDALAKAGAVDMPSYDQAIARADGMQRGPFDPEGCWFWIERLAA